MTEPQLLLCKLQFFYDLSVVDTIYHLPFEVVTARFLENYDRYNYRYVSWKRDYADQNRGQKVENILASPNLINPYSM